MGLTLIQGFAELRPGQVQSGPAATVRVLVVDDSRDAADSLRDLLEASGYAVAVSYSGAEAVEAARRFRPGIVLCDLGLPDMSGYEVAAALRQDPNTAAARLIAVSGYGQDEDLRRSTWAGFAPHLVKPVAFEALQPLLDL